MNVLEPFRQLQEIYHLYPNPFYVVKTKFCVPDIKKAMQPNKNVTNWQYDTGFL